MISRGKSSWAAKIAGQETSKPKEFKDSSRKKTGKNVELSRNTRTRRAH